MKKEKIRETIIIEPGEAQPAAVATAVVAAASPFAAFKRGKSSNWLVFGASALVALIFTFVGFLLLDAVFNPTVAAAAPAGDDSYPRMAADLPGRVEAALNNENLSVPHDLTMLFDNKLTSGGAALVAGGVGSPLQPGANQILTARSPLPLPPASAGVPPYRANSSQLPTLLPFPASTGEQSSSANPTSPAMPAAAADAVLERLQKRQNAVRRNETVPAIWEAFDIEDVVPMGVVGDEKSRDVGFYSPATKQRFSAPIGAHFNNGTLVGAASSGGDLIGVRFKNTSTGATFVRPFARGKKGKEVGDSPYLPDRAAEDAPPTPPAETRPSNPPAKRQTARRGKN